MGHRMNAWWIKGKQSQVKRPHLLSLVHFEVATPRFGAGGASVAAATAHAVGELQRGAWLHGLLIFKRHSGASQPLHGSSVR